LIRESSKTALIAMLPSFGALNEDKPPFSVPIGVLLAEVITTFI
jgi:hypothetical protein